MAQEVNPLQTNNSTGASGFFGGLLTGLSNLVTTAAPVAANVYQLKTQADILKNQAANQLAQSQLQAAQLSAAAKTPAPGMSPTAATLPKWVPYAVVGVIVFVVVAVVMRLRRR